MNLDFLGGGFGSPKRHNCENRGGGGGLFKCGYGLEMRDGFMMMELL